MKKFSCIVVRLEPWKKRTEEVQEAFQKEPPS